MATEKNSITKTFCHHTLSFAVKFRGASNGTKHRNYSINQASYCRVLIKKLTIKL